MSPEQKTKGFEIIDIVLKESVFKLIAEIKLASQLPESRTGGLELRVLPEAAPSIGEVLRHTLRVAIAGIDDNIRAWEAEVAYQGLFRRSQESEVTEEMVRQIHMPAILYGFAREHLADLTRRARVGTIFLPPMRFTPTSVPQ